MRVRLGFLFLLVAAVLASPATAGPSGSFRDWTVACTDGLSCTASTGPDDYQGLYAVAFSRDAQPEAEPRFVLSTGEVGPLETPVVIEVDGGETISLPPEMLTPGADGGGLQVADPGQVAEILDLVRNGDRLAVSFEAGGQSFAEEFSLAGLVAALIFIDEAQGRDGTATALQARGDAPGRDPESLPRDVAREDLPEAVRAAWESDPSGCAELSFEPESLGFSAAVEQGRLFGLLCGSPGAYNYFYKFFLEAEWGVVPVPLPGMSDEGPIASAGAWNIDWNDGERLLQASFRGRGLGDCGTFDRWRWLGEGEGGFVLLEARAKGECDGDAAGGPENWPAVWPAP